MGNARCKLNLGITYEEQGDDEKAQEWYLQVIHAKSEYVAKDARLYLGSIFKEKNMFALAKHMYLSISDKFHQEVDKKTSRLFARYDYREARVKYYEKHSIQCFNCAYDLAHEYRRIGDVTKLLDLHNTILSHLVRNDEIDQDMVYNLGFLYLQAGCISEARELCEMAPSDGRALNWLGVFKIIDGDLMKGKDFFVRAYNVGNYKALCNLAILAHAQGNDSEAKEWLAEARKRANEDDRCNIAFYFWYKKQIRNAKKWAPNIQDIAACMEIRAINGDESSDTNLNFYKKLAAGI